MPRGFLSYIGRNQPENEGDMRRAGPTHEEGVRRFRAFSTRDGSRGEVNKEADDGHSREQAAQGWKLRGQSHQPLHVSSRTAQTRRATTHVEPPCSLARHHEALRERPSVTSIVGRRERPERKLTSAPIPTSADAPTSIPTTVTFSLPKLNGVVMLMRRDMASLRGAL